MYVHCFAGVSRSATIVISFLMKKFEWSLNQALTFTKKRRRYIDPNPGFMRQLRKYERELANPGGKGEIEGEVLKKTATSEKTTFLEGFKKYAPSKSVIKENKDGYGSPKDTKKSLLRVSRPFLVQDINRMYPSSGLGLKKGLSLGKQNRLPELNSAVDKYL